MKSAVALACLLALAGVAVARTSGDFLILDSSEAELMGALQLPGEAPEQEEAFAIIEWDVLPSKADGLIDIVKEVKSKAKQCEGYKQLNFVRALDTNIKYCLWLHWDSKEALLKYVKSEEGQQLKEYARKQDLVIKATPVEPLV